MLLILNIQINKNQNNSAVTKAITEYMAHELFRFVKEAYCTLIKIW